METLSVQLLQAGIVLLVAILVRVVVVLAINNIRRLLLAKPPKQLELIGDRASSLLGRDADQFGSRHRQRIETLASLLRNVADTVIVVVAILTILAIFNIPMAPLLASAGIGGVAIGFGAQSLVKDYLSGIFMLAEDQFGVGDVIKIDDVTGTVEEVTLRVTKVRDASGTIWYLRNGEILKLGNVSQSSTSTILEVYVAPDEDPARATEVIQGAIKGMHEEPEFAESLMGEPTVLGVGGVDASKMTMQVLLSTAPNQQWAPMRAVRSRAQRALSSAGVRGPLLPGRAED